MASLLAKLQMTSSVIEGTIGPMIGPRFFHLLLQIKSSPDLTNCLCILSFCPCSPDMLPTSFQSTTLPLVDLYTFYSHNYPSLLFCSSPKHPETTWFSLMLPYATNSAGQWQPSSQSILPHFNKHQLPLIYILYTITTAFNESYQK